MVVYKVKVWTGDHPEASTLDTISITLVGTEGESAKSPLDHIGKDFWPGGTDEYNIKVKHNLGEIILIRLYKEKFGFFPANSWYCNKVNVETPAGVVYHFPCYHWIEGYRMIELPEGTAKLPMARGNPILIQQAKDELTEKQNSFKYKVYQPGSPKCLDVASPDELHSDEKFSFTKSLNFDAKVGVTKLERALHGFKGTEDSWSSFDEFQRAIWAHHTEVSEYVAEHWKDDSFFGYQFLNGVDPSVIQKISKIPDNFPVTDDMVASSLGASTSLEKELMNGSIFLADYKILEEIPANLIHGEQQFMGAPMVLLHCTPEKKLIPLAIQISQTPGPENPIFLPSDGEWDWMLAKMWARNAYFNYHVSVTDYLKTFAMAEVFTLATLRQLPMSHPLYKMLVPHMRYTLNMNAIIRHMLLGQGGPADTGTSMGLKGINEMNARAMKSLKYSSFILPENLQSRGIDSLPNFYYRDDAMQIWSAIESFVSSIVDCYYKDEKSIKSDPELQAWVLEIFTEGFLENCSSGVPSSLETRAELIKYLTMWIFNCSAQHTAVNKGQFDFHGWMPNGVYTMRQAPPTTKGTATMEHILKTLPNVAATTTILTALWLVSSDLGDRRPLGTYPEEYFTEEEPKLAMEAFQERLSGISAKIDARNATLALKYNVLNPKEIENSVTL